MTLVRADGVSHKRGSTTVLHDISLSFAPGRLAVLAGRSGSGKSTLLHLVAGVMTPTAGTVRVDGTPAHKVRDWATASLLPQRLALAGELTVAENALLPAHIRRRTPDPGLLDRLGLAGIAGRPVHQTSQGERQRTALARALVLGPALAVLDEPTGHQDDEHVGMVLDALRAAVAGGTLVLVATHDERIIEVADEVVRLGSGRVL